MKKKNENKIKLAHELLRLFKNNEMDVVEILLIRDTDLVYAIFNAPSNMKIQNDDGII